MSRDRFGKLKEFLLQKRRILFSGGLALVGLCIVAWLIVDFYWSERESEAKMEELRQQMANMTEPLAEPSTENEGETEQEELKEERVPNPYGALFAQNDDMAAWLVVDGTVINYPVMQTMEDENYYLERDFEGNADKSGCLILDTDSSLYGAGTTNLIIHGHNMKAGTMFGGLSSYESEDYYQDHKQITLYTKGEERQYEVIAAFYSQVYYATDLVFKYYNFFQADTEEEFRYFYDNIKELSLYDTGVTAELGDKFLTLSTCAYHVEDGRFVVVAKEIGRGPKYE
ncbi:MAG: class B sortase [Acetatifactor sp.]|nr:class B sortase [Acetatifactor sp.]